MKLRIFIFIHVFSFLFSTNYYVATTGTDNATCQSSNPCEQVQTAINLTGDGDVVIVSGGTYLENLLITHAITLKSESPSYPAIIDGSSPSNNGPNDWNGSCIVVKTANGSSSRITAIIEDIEVTGGKGTLIKEDSNKNGSFNDPEDISKKVGGGIIVHHAGLVSRRNKIMNNGDSSTQEGGGIYAAGTGADVPDPNPNLPPPDDDERSSIVFEETMFSDNDAQVGHTVMVNGWDPENQFIDMDFGNSQFDVIFDSEDNELDDVTEYWVKGKDNVMFDFTGGITGENDAIVTDVWVDPVNGIDEGNVIGSQSNPFLTIDYAMGFIYSTEYNSVILSGTFPSATYYITGNIMIAQENIVILRDDTKFLFDGPYGFNIYGTLIAQGTEKDSIIFDNYNDFSDNIWPPDENRWKGFTLENVGEETIFEYVRITGARKFAESEQYISGGGMNLSYSDPVLRHLQINNNAAAYGGGIQLYYSNPTVDHVTISGNVSMFHGAIKFWHSNAILNNVNIVNNGGGYYYKGGGVYIYHSNPFFNDVNISDNFGDYGAGIRIEHNSHPNFSNVFIYDNVALMMGGAIFVLEASFTASSTFITNNYASHKAGGIYLGSELINSENEVFLQNAIIANNYSGGHGSGIFLSAGSKIFLQNSTIVGNMVGEGDVFGAGIYSDGGNANLVNSIVYYNRRIGDFSPNYNLNGWSQDLFLEYDVSYSDIEGDEEWLSEGVGNISLDPEFVDFENTGDFTLQSNSPCIDAGTADLDGDGIDDVTDYFGQAPDMGAYEFEGSSLSGDLNGDGMLNVLDVVVLVNIVLGNAEFIPAGDLNGDGVINVLDVVVLVGIILEG